MHEKLASKQMSPTRSSPDGSSPVLDGVLHISEESLANVVCCPDPMSNGYAPVSIDDDSRPVASNESEDANLNQSLPSASVSPIVNSPSILQSAVAQPESSSNSVTLCSESPMNYVSSQSPLVSGGHQVLHSVPNASQLMSASYPSAGYPVFGSQHQMLSPLVHPTMSRFISPGNFYQQSNYYPPQSFQPSNADPALLQSSPNLTAHANVYQQPLQAVSITFTLWYYVFGNFPTDSPVSFDVIYKSHAHI